jgi:N6-adenosine-specific RNA methylase IME4
MADCDLSHLPRIAGGWKTIVADPPWSFKSRTAIKSENWGSIRHVERHYNTMSLDGIKAMPVREIACKKECHLFLWTTAPHMPQALEVMEAWGFKYSTIAFTWVKLRRAHNAMQLRFTPTIDADFHVGLGLTTRKNAEFVLLGRRGSPKRLAKDVRELIIAPVRAHSRKPDEPWMDGLGK